MPDASKPTVLRLNGPVVLDWGNGMRLRLSPEGPAFMATAPAEAPRRRGRKPSPATQALIEAMASDAASGTARSRSEYLQTLRKAGGPSGPSAGIVVNREAKRAFGRSLPRGRKEAKRTIGSTGARGRQPSPATAALREKLSKDKAAGSLREPAHYVRWLVDQPGVKIGLKGARPIVYRGLRALR